MVMDMLVRELLIFWRKIKMYKFDNVPLIITGSTDSFDFAV